MATETINGVTLSYIEQGQGQPLVLLHGFPLDRRIWRAQIEELSRRCRVIAVDLRGFGQSRGPLDFTLAALADDVHALLGKIGALPCVLGGLSMGGYVALEFVHKYPTDLRGLMLVDTKAEGDTAEAKKAREEMAELARAKGSHAVAEKMMPKMLCEATHKTRPEVVKEVWEIMDQCPPATIARACLAMRDRKDHTCDLPSVPVPTLVVVGAADAIIPVSLAEQTAAAIPHAQLAVIPDAGHLSTMEQPQRVNEVMARFVGELG